MRRICNKETVAHGVLASHEAALMKGLVVTGMALALGACTPDREDTPAAKAPAHEPLSVYTVNYPLQYFAERIGGELVVAVFPGPAGEDPAYWSPAADEVAAYQRADLVLLNGAHYARWIERATLPRAKLVDTTSAVRERYLTVDDTVTHKHGPEGEHSHADLASTTWLDPTLASTQAAAIAAALEEIRPPHARDLGDRLAALDDDLRDLDERLAAAVQALGGAPVLFSHPVYQYFARRYTINGRSLHWEPGQQPDADAWREVAELLAKHPARWMLWEAEPLAATAARLETLGVSSVVFEPCANRPARGDFLSVMRANADRLGQAFATPR